MSFRWKLRRVGYPDVYEISGDRVQTGRQPTAPYAAHEEHQLHKAVEDIDELCFEDDDVEVDYDLFKKMLHHQLKLEPESELTPGSSSAPVRSEWHSNTCSAPELERKKVCFKIDSEMGQTLDTPVARGSHLPVVHKKDAPTPRNIVSQQQQQKDVDLADVLYNVLCLDSELITDELNEAQKNAILQTADACTRAEPTICMIEGPPGTGKSHAIVNLIIQMLYAHKQYRKPGRPRKTPRILVCAPNAAVDEVVIRLLHICQSIQEEDRFRMVSTGRLETMKPSVKDILVVELAKKDARSNAQNLEYVQNVELEIRILEARKNVLSMTLETAKQNDEKDIISETEFKLHEVETKLSQMRNSNTQDSSMHSQYLLPLERDAQSRIILGADHRSYI